MTTEQAKRFLKRHTTQTGGNNVEQEERKDPALSKIESGATDYMSKPMRLREFVERITALLEK